MYHLSSWLIIGILFALLLLAIECGYRIGRRHEEGVGAATKSQINSLQGSMLGILALLLGFTYSLSLERYDSRSEVVVDESLALDKAYFRSKLLPPSNQNQAQELLREYLDERVRAAGISLDKNNERVRLLNEAQKKLDALAKVARESATEDSSLVHSGLFIESLNDLYDALGKREAALEQQVPEFVLWILFATIILNGFVVGHASGIEGHRVSVTVYALVLLIFLVVLLIMDLDRPRRGLIQVQQQSLTYFENFDYLNNRD